MKDPINNAVEGVAEIVETVVETAAEVIPEVAELTEDVTELVTGKTKPIIFTGHVVEHIKPILDKLQDAKTSFELSIKLIDIHEVFDEIHKKFETVRQKYITTNGYQDENGDYTLAPREVTVKDDEGNETTTIDNSHFRAWQQWYSEAANTVANVKEFTHLTVEEFKEVTKSVQDITVREIKVLKDHGIIK